MAEQLDLLIDASRDVAILTLSAEGHITSWNKGAERIEGYTADEILGQHVSVFYPPEDVAAKKVEHELRIAVATGRYEEEGWRVRKDGTTFWASVVIKAIYNDYGGVAGFGKVTRDMTERRRFVQELQAARDATDRASQAKDQFIAHMSHEMRTPLSGILGFSQLLQDNEHLSADDRESVDHIAAAGDHLLDLVNDVLDLSRVLAGDSSIQTKPVDIAETVKLATGFVRPMAQAHDVTITNTGTDDMFVLADPKRLRQVLLNLLSNAVKFNRPGGHVHVTWRKNTRGRGHIQVTDTGRGIAPELLDNLFVPFDRLDADVVGIAGTGLGLSLSKTLAEAMRGAIEVTSTVGQGTTFTIDLPMPVTATLTH